MASKFMVRLMMRMAARELNVLIIWNWKSKVRAVAVVVIVVRRIAIVQMIDATK